MFVAGVILPGFVLGRRGEFARGASWPTVQGARPPLDLRELMAATWVAKWELALPVIIVGSIFTGLTNLVEAAAFTAAYAIFVEVFIHRDLSLTRDMPRVARECSVLVGAVLIILGVAMGFTSYLVDAEVPEAALDWVKGDIESKWVFLLALNVFLLVVGCLMDIFSAIVVVVPLILPIGAHFGVHPIHLGIIFFGEPRTRFLNSPRWHESFSVLGSLQEAVIPSLRVRLAVSDHSRSGGAVDNVFASPHPRACRMGLRIAAGRFPHQILTR